MPNRIHTGSQPDIEVFVVAHEPLAFAQPVPPHIGLHLEGHLTHPGDAINITSTREVLALPVTAPWGSFKEALEIAANLKPKAVIPIHDWPWHKLARQTMYSMGKELLAPYGIEFIELENGNPVEL
jgi:hypothetical protein